ncbi:serine hydrolase domain-containing protein [Streptomyces sp. NPDC052051]|uniref:serine hydrolase domain-containing protein n=1 Tax=Streptomyces sp. NPDC052051 TaxID=3154649 RepID=UPI003427EE94
MTADVTRDDLARLQDSLTSTVADGAAPGGVLVYGSTTGTPAVLTAGIIAAELGETAPDEDTLYDIASLTKVVATWPLVGRALAAGFLDLDQPVRNYLPPMSGETPSGQATVRQLLAHTSGLRASTRLDLYRGSTAEPLHELLCREPLEDVPGSHRYINRGYILLGLALAHVHGRPLDVLASELWNGLGMQESQYGPVGRRPQVAPTEQRIPGAPRIWGAPHDDNAALMGGVAGHAGVFATARDLAAYATALLTAYQDGDALGLGAWLRNSLAPQAVIEPGLDRGLSWILAADGHVMYHHGFTGTSLYLAPESGRYLLILTNAVYNGQARTRIAPLRALALKTLSAT